GPPAGAAGLVRLGVRTVHGPDHHRHRPAELLLNAYAGASRVPLLSLITRTRWPTLNCGSLWTTAMSRPLSRRTNHWIDSLRPIAIPACRPSAAPAVAPAPVARIRPVPPPTCWPAAAPATPP